MTSTSVASGASAEAALPLRMRDITLRFGGHVALDKVMVDVVPGSVHGLVGPNGAGKTSLLNCLSGLYTPDAGTIYLGDVDVLQLRQRDRIAHGMGRTFQHPTLIDELTILENVLLTAERSGQTGAPGDAMSTPREVATWALDLVEVARPHTRLVHGLPYGERKRIDMARALAMRPRVLLLDEPLAGTHGPERASMLTCIDRLRTHGTSVLLIEHDVGAVKRISDYMTVLSFGQVIATGRPDDVMARPAVRQAYLGADVAAAPDAAGPRENS